jgi:hypothetical protein
MQVSTGHLLEKGWSVTSVLGGTPDSFYNNDVSTTLNDLRQGIMTFGLHGSAVFEKEIEIIKLLFIVSSIPKKELLNALKM